MNMFNDSKYRFLTVVILLVLLSAMFVYHGGLEPDPSEGDYPGEKYLIKDYEDFVGRRAEVTGEVVGTDPVSIEIEYGDETKILTVTGTDSDVNEGDRLSVYGTVREDDTIESENSFAVPFINYVYMYSVSLIAAVWILIRIITQWRWNKEEFTFEQREEPSPLKQLLTGGEDDG